MPLSLAEGQLYLTDTYKCPENH